MDSVAELTWYVPVAVLALFPILLWGYLFSYLDNSPLNARRFGIGLFAGGLSVVPVLFLSDILGVLHFDRIDPFVLLSWGSGTLSLSFAVSSSMVIIAIVLFVVGSIVFPRCGGLAIGTYLKSLMIFAVSSVAFFVLVPVMGVIPWFARPLGDGVVISWHSVATLSVVCLYYAIVGLSEEGSKHWSFLVSSLQESTTLRHGIVFSIFVALGFAFTENVLYLHAILKNSGAFDTVFFITWSLRSLFSTFVHVFSGAILAHAFFRVYSVRPFYSLLSMDSLRILVSGIFLAVFTHAVFDISLTGGFIAIVFVYAVIGYLAITSMLYGYDGRG